MAISKSDQLKRLSRKLEGLSKEGFSGEVSLRIEFGNVVHVSTAHGLATDDVVAHLVPLLDKNFFGKLHISMEDGTIKEVTQVEDDKIHL